MHVVFVAQTVAEGIDALQRSPFGIQLIARHSSQRVMVGNKAAQWVVGEAFDGAVGVSDTVQPITAVEA